jgi:hypothetical protein
MFYLLLAIALKQPTMFDERTLKAIHYESSYGKPIIKRVRHAFCSVISVTVSNINL